MSSMDKINIYVPSDTARILDQDAWLFEIYNPGKTRINRNHFLSLLLIGYYNKYSDERLSALETIRTELKPHKLTESDIDEIASNILNKVVLPDVPKRKGKNPTNLSLKPTADTEGIILSIKKDLSQYDYISQYLCKMFMSYTRKPLYEREQIIFKQNLEFLSNACKLHRPISFSTIWNTNPVHEVYPYRMSIGQDEMFNYLLCQEINNLGKPEARTYRLSRLLHLNYIPKAMSLDRVVKDHFEKMQQYGVQFPINEDFTTCVKLNKSGVSSFSKIYHGRPKPERIENCQDGQLYYFNCSEEQIILYFRKFDAGEAEVIYPAKIRDRVIAFHKKALEGYSDSADK